MPSCNPRILDLCKEDIRDYQSRSIKTASMTKKERRDMYNQIYYAYKVMCEEPEFKRYLRMKRYKHVVDFMKPESMYDRLQYSRRIDKVVRDGPALHPEVSKSQYSQYCKTVRNNPLYKEAKLILEERERLELEAGPVLTYAKLDIRNYFKNPDATEEEQLETMRIRKRISSAYNKLMKDPRFEVYRNSPEYSHIKKRFGRIYVDTNEI